MLIKGCKKNLLIIKSLGSDYIEEAYLILRPELPPSTGRNDIVKEANRIIHEYETGKKKKHKPFSLPSFFLGMCTASAVGLLIFLCSVWING